MTNAEATVRFCILDGLCQASTPERQVDRILESLFSETAWWAILEYLEYLKELKRGHTK